MAHPFLISNLRGAESDRIAIVETGAHPLRCAGVTSVPRSTRMPPIETTERLRLKPSLAKEPAP
ncbi:MAG: hypothetical protein ACREFX_13770 [Opitutaceae bacterium]